jgi:hypothetical protein
MDGRQEGGVNFVPRGYISAWAYASCRCVAMTCYESNTTVMELGMCAQCDTVFPCMSLDAISVVR